MNAKNLALIMILVLPLASHANDSRVYRHPSNGLAFSSPRSFRQVARPEDGAIHHLRDGTLDVVLWHTDTQQSARKYCWKMSNMRDVEDPGEPSPITVAGGEAWQVTALGREFGRDVIETMVVLSAGPSPSLPDHLRLLVILIWGPRRPLEEWRSVTDEILDSVTVTR